MQPYMQNELLLLILRLRLPSSVLSLQLPMVSVLSGALILDSKLDQNFLEPSNWLVCLFHEVLKCPEVLQTMTHRPSNTGRSDDTAEA